VAGIIAPAQLAEHIRVDGPYPECDGSLACGCHVFILRRADQEVWPESALTVAAAAASLRAGQQVFPDPGAMRAGPGRARMSPDGPGRARTSRDGPGRDVPG
jgi:hypothetical protein